MTKIVKIAVVGCGITGSTLTSQLLSRLPSSLPSTSTAQIRVYDQGYRPGGRTSSRLLTQLDDTDTEILVDHGCQFFRADLPTSRSIVDSWVDQGFVKKLDSIKSSSSSSSSSFFGFPNHPPFFYPTSGGMVGLVNNQVSTWPSDSVTVSSSHRVTSVEKVNDPSCSSHETSFKFKVTSTTGRNAIHDTADKDMSAAPPTEVDLFDAVVFTDVSSTSFKSWHRASALGGEGSGVPEEFLADVRARLDVSGRVPLFSCIVVFETPLQLEGGAEAVTFEDDQGAAWFCCRSSAKLGESPPSSPSSTLDAWVIISTPKFGVDEITRVPMQTEDGKFIPQDKGYLRDGPCQALLDDLRSFAKTPLPKIVHLDGQRWGSALPGVKFNGVEGGKKVCRDVLYDGVMQDLAPTVAYPSPAFNEKSFVMHESGLFQAGDMMSLTSPGVEGAIISAAECSDAVIDLISKK
ncbi:hypothetical protein TrVE_jg3975 [Triparma verrucosa]|uniref:FAD/NAD(P)-binding domain-containing protein n=1 Tax=Triparma verrucosa TaxID=1606542 RepID=A0A9W7BDV7_9STRA|nr:hypothetical protein TrVE_jg3975 [Triparma verrucosa]